MKKKKIHETQNETNTTSSAKTTTTNSVGRCAREGDVKLTDWIHAGTMNGGGDGGTGFGGENVSNNNNNNNARTARCVRVRAGPSLLLPLVKTVSRFVRGRRVKTSETVRAGGPGSA